MSRFGFDVRSGAAETALRRMRAIPGLRIRGLHIHLATQPKTLESFLARLRGLLDATGRAFGDHPPEYLDVGGGFCPPGAPAGGPTFDEYAAAVADEFGRRYSRDGPELLLEPGVAVALDTMTYVCRVLDVKTIGTRQVAVTTGSIHTIRPTGYDRHSQMSVVSPRPRPEGGRPVTLGGYTCMEHDLLAVDYASEVAPGDFLTVTNVGAYTMVFKPPFIGLAPPILVPGPRGGWEPARRAETVDDLLSLYPASRR